jgi:hypothetical protein
MEPMAIDDNTSEGSTAVTLLDLPTEVLCLVALAIDRGRDLIAWACATRTPIDDALVTMATRYAVDLKCPASLIQRGVPSALAVRAWNRMGAVPHIEWLDKLQTASGLAIEWLFAHLARRSDPVQCSPDDCPAERPPVIRERRWRDVLERDTVISFIYRANTDAGAAALEQSARIGIWVPASHIVQLMTQAIREKKTDLFRSLHARLLDVVGDDDDSDWARTIGKEIIAIDADDFAEQVCNGQYAHVLPHDLMGHALWVNKPRILEWMIARAPKDAHGRVPRLADDKFVRDHIKRDRVDILALAHDSGLWRFTESTLAWAARRGRSRIIRWAAGEGRDRGRPIKAWRSGMAAYGIVESNITGNLLWMLARPDARQIVNTGVLRAAVACGNAQHVAAIHDSGLASLLSWRALDDALENHDDPALLEVICDRGGQCDVAAWRMAIKHDRQASLSCLVRRFGTVHLQEAVDGVTGALRVRNHSLYRYRGHVKSDPCHAIAWVRDNVPTICVREAHKAAVASCYKGGLAQRNFFTRDGCRCVRCAANN